MTKFFALMLVLSLASGPHVLAEETTIKIEDRQVRAVESEEDKAADEKDTTMVFHEMPMREVLRLIAQEYDLNIVMSEEVQGSVTLRLKGTTLENTLDALLLPRGFDYDLRDNIIWVAGSEVIQTERQKRLSRQELEPLIATVVQLRYIDANDVKPMVTSMLTTRGSVTTLERRPYRGFQFSAQTTGYNSASGGTGGGGAQASTGSFVQGRQRDADEKPFSNTLMITDVRAQIIRIQEILDQVDVPPRQVLIDAKILEVTTDTLEDLGLDFNGSYFAQRAEAGDPSSSISTDINSDESDTEINDDVFTNLFPTTTDAGFHAVFRKLRGSDMTVTLHALLQDKRTRTLSSPQIMAIENQEAAILVGEQFPIFQSSVSDQGTTTESLSYFQPVGVSLQVIAQITPENEISMIVHPTVSSIGTFVTGTSGLQQPRINTREADTRVLMKNGETLVIGGLLSEVDDRRYFSFPYLDRLPVIGRLFTRRQIDIDQTNLLIFITPKIVEPGKDNLTQAQKLTLEAIKNPARYGFLGERRELVDNIYDEAKKNYELKNYETARAQFLEVISINPEHKGAADHLQKMKALPLDKPIG